MDIKKHTDKPFRIQKKEPIQIRTIKKRGSRATDHRLFENYQKRMQISKASLNPKKGTLKAVGVAGANTALKQVEGGEEVGEASYVAYSLGKPVGVGGKRGYQLAKYGGKKIAGMHKGREIQKKASKVAVKKAAKKAAKETAKEVTKGTTKVVVSTTTTTAGSAVSPLVGTVIGAGIGYGVGVSIEQQDRKWSNRSRMMKFFVDKMQAKERQADSLKKIAQDVLIRNIAFQLQKITSLLGVALSTILGILLLGIVPIVAIFAIAYNSPLALFFPPLEEGESILNVTSGYVATFHAEVNQIASTHEGYEEGKVVYVDYEGNTSNPSNYYDILGVYMVRYGIGDTATVMNESSKERLQEVVHDMCSYSTSSANETIEQEDGTTTEQSVLLVNVTLKTYHDMIIEYGFDEEEIEILKEVMKPSNLAMIGYGSGSSGGITSQSSMTQAEIDAIVSGITDPLQKEACYFALTKVGYPYSQAYRHSGDYYDCSSLAYYAWMAAGVDISYGGATTAAEEAKGLYQAGKVVDYSQMQAGDLIFFNYTNNGRFMNIGHVAIYIGDGMVVEAQNERTGVVYGSVPSRSKIALIARP